MAKKKNSFRFTAQVYETDIKYGGLRVDFPEDVEKLFGTKGPVRMVGTINGIPARRALMPRGDGMHFIIIPGEMRRKLRLQDGDKVLIDLQPDPNPQEVEMPEELIATLEMEPDVYAHFERQNISMRRNICYWVNSAKRVETRIQRSLEVLRRFQSGTGMFGSTKLKP